MLVYGSDIAKKIREKVKRDLRGQNPHLAVVLVGAFAPSLAYVNMKKKACAEVGIKVTIHTFPDTVLAQEIFIFIDDLNQDANVDGILVQLPLPPHLNPFDVMERVSPKKDVDGLTATNMGKLLLGMEGGFVPCTPLGIQVLLHESGIETHQQHVVVVGRSNIVGKPLAALLCQKKSTADATVTLAHGQTRHLEEITRSADIVIVAVGRPRFLTGSMIKEGAVVIDVGINRVDKELIGDVDFASCAPKCRAITPVPKGVGPMTVAMLLHNTALAFERKQ